MEYNDKHIEVISGLIAKRWFGDLTDAEQSLLEDWKREHAANEELYNRWMAEIPLIDEYREFNAVDPEESKINLRNYIQEKARGHKIRAIAWYLSTACVLLVLTFSLLFWGETGSGNHVARIEPAIPFITFGDGTVIPVDSAFSIHQEDNVFVKKNDITSLAYTLKDTCILAKNTKNTVHVPKGTELDITLSDGTRVWLNADSKITFPVAFTGNLREVEVSGEVYFAVARDTLHPFRVITPLQTIEVLGTEFNINAYPDGKNTYTTLVSGSVKVIANNEEKILVPGEQSVVSEDYFLLREVRIKNITSWRQGMFVFEDLTIGEILSMLSRWYEFNVFYQNQKVQEIQLRGTIPRYESFEKIFRVLEGTKEVKFEIKGDNITVMEY